MRELSAAFPRVLVVPAHASSGWLWSGHLGERPGSSSGSTTVNTGGMTVTKPTVDCTHLCYSPHFYQPLWASILIAVNSSDCMGTEARMEETDRRPTPIPATKRWFPIFCELNNAPGCI